MSAVSMDAKTDLEAGVGGADEISARLESLPASSYAWRLVILLSLGGCFEIYDLFLTGYIAPGLNKSGLLPVISYSTMCWATRNRQFSNNPMRISAPGAPLRF